MAYAGAPAYHGVASPPPRASYASPPPSMGLPSFGGAPPLPPAAVPQGTLAPGTVVRIGEYTVTVERFLSEGGFAHVYLATSETPIPTGSPMATKKHVLKRMAVPDKKGVEEVGKEVEVMKALRNHPKIVNFLAASVSEMKSSSGTSAGYEIYILMEWCAGGGIIDMMNTRLQNRLTETEILKVFSDTVEAVAHMHYQNPPLIHRDLKVENILLSPPQTYKLCDFGSTTTPLKNVPTAAAELQAIELEINKTTTLQYRAPELVDVWSRKGYDEKIDIWALGVFLYKLCYYTTPFEEHGPLAILNAQYKIPPYPAYSSAIKLLIGGMLQERAQQRPNIYQVHEQVCKLRGTSVKLENKYASISATPSLSTSTTPVPKFTANILSTSPVPPSSSPSHGMPEIAPMRRGRPTKPSDVASQPIPLATDNRMVRTGIASQSAWEISPSSGPIVPHAAGLAAPTWHAGAASSAPTSKAPTPPGSANGFGDSFSGGFQESFTAPSPTSPNPSLPISSSLSGNGGAASGSLFSDLVAPNSASAAGGNAALRPHSGAGVPAGGAGHSAWRASPSPLSGAGGRGARPPSSSGLEVGGSAGDSKAYDGLGAAFGGSGSSSFGTPSSSSSTAATTLVSPPSQQTIAPSDEAGPPLPRRPPTKAAKPLPNPSFSSSSSALATEASNRSKPRPSFIPTKPELINRASQTSPKLLDDWRLRDVGSNPSTLGAGGVGGAKTEEWKTKSLPNPSVAAGSSSSSGFDKPDPPLPVPRMAPAAIPISKPPQKDLLGDDDDDDDGFGPPTRGGQTPTPPAVVEKAPPPSDNLTNSRFSLASSTSATSSPTTQREKFRPTKPVKSLGGDRGGEDDAADRFPALEDFDAPPLSSSSSFAKRNQGSWTEIVEREDPVDADSSDDEPEKAEPLPPPPPSSTSSAAFSPPPLSSMDRDSTPVGDSLPPINRILSPDDDDEESTGRIDLAPALASIQKFAPSYNPPPASSSSASSPSQPQRRASSPGLIAPKPQTAKRVAAINSLVSRYEKISTTEPPPVSPSGAKRAPPPLASKPASLRGELTGQSSLGGGRKSSVSSISSASNNSNFGGYGGGREKEKESWSSPKASVEGFQSRFPDQGGLDDLFASSTASPSSASAAVPASSPSYSSTIAAGGGRAPPFKPVPPPKSPQTSQKEGGDEEEEKFAGVRNMRSRWESMGKAGGASSGGGAGGSTTGPGNVKVRKEWGVV